MSARVLVAEALSPEAFAPFGDVIAPRADRRDAMNAARFERFDDLAVIDVDQNGDAHAAISIARARSATELPYHFDVIERHPLGSQAFVPLAAFRFVVVVGPPGDAPETDELRAFVTNGRQGINYRRGVWHMPLIALEAGQQFLIVDRAGGAGNLDEHVLDRAVGVRTG